MLYQRTLLIPATTPEDTPAEATIVIKHPVISRIKVLIPPGGKGLVSSAIFYGDLQLWPSKEGEWLSGDDIVVEDEPFFEMPEAETTLRLLGISPGTTLEHRLFFYFTAIHLEEVPPTRELIRVADVFEEFMTLIGAR